MRGNYLVTVTFCSTVAPTAIPSRSAKVRITLETSNEEFLTNLSREYKHHITVHYGWFQYKKVVDDTSHDLVIHPTLGANGLV